MTNPNPSPIGIGFGFVLFGASVLTESARKSSKINGLWQPTNGMNDCFMNIFQIKHYVVSFISVQ